MNITMKKDLFETNFTSKNKDKIKNYAQNHYHQEGGKVKAR